MGLVLHKTLAVLLLAVDSRAAVCAGLRGRARSGAYARNESRPALLAIGGAIGRRCGKASGLAAREGLPAAPLHATPKCFQAPQRELAGVCVAPKWA